MVEVDPTAQDVLQVRVPLEVADEPAGRPVHSGVAEVAEPGREPHPEEVEEREDEIGVAGVVRCVLQDGVGSECMQKPATSARVFGVGENDTLSGGMRWGRCSSGVGKPGSIDIQKKPW